ncbi:MAG TPA: lytic transglycosylase domain-containing protein [Chitinophagaceae bacterium]|nr:lytic transglycosylase domain-containing protein [Chitinophagaceae bacterium]
MNRHKIKYLAAGLLLGSGLVGLIAFNKADKNDEKVEVKEDGRLQYKWYAPQTPTKASFAGEPVPLDRWEVRERYDRELLMNYYMHGSLMYILKLSYRQFPVIEKELKANGIPDDFKYLCVAESNLQNLVSAAGAQGYWQFMNSTAPSYGLEVTSEVDERYNLKKATQAACQYFIQAHNKFGSWTAAAASYNCGMGGYNGHATFQGSNNYYDIALPEETNRYIFRILAFKNLISTASSWGYILQPEDTYRPLRTRILSVDTAITNLATFAQAQGSSYKILKVMNPWLRARNLPAKKGKTYEIELPLN